MPGERKTYVKLAEAMNARRLELGLRWADVTARGGPSVEQMVLIRRGTVGNIRDLTLAAIATGLGWPLEHVLALAAEEDPAGEGEPDAFERAVAASDKPDAVKAAAIRRHREQARAQLAELGLDENAIIVPDVIRAGIDRLTRGDDADDGHGQAGRRA